MKIRNLKKLKKIFIFTTVLLMMFTPLGTNINDNEHLNYKKAYADVNHKRGHLNAGAVWIDDSGERHVNRQTCEIEIYPDDVIDMKFMKGTRRYVLIYFINGENAGKYGRTAQKNVSSLYQDRF